MTANPYAPDAADHFDEPKSTSVLAIASLVLAILGLISACFLVGGVLGAIGALLGVIALATIGGSGGKTGGSGIAISGIVVGLLASLIAGVMGFGAWTVLGYALKMGAPIEHVANRDYEALRDSMIADVRPQVTDESIDAFAAAIESEHGKLVGLPDGMMDWFSGYTELDPSNPPDPASTPYGNQGVIPLPIDHDNGKVLYWLVLDENNTGPNGLPLLRNLGVALTDDTLWLGPLPGGTQVAPELEAPPADEPGVEEPATDDAEVPAGDG